MDGTRFDELTRRFGAGLNRRQMLRGLLGGAGAITAAGVFAQSADAQACDPNADTVTCPAGTHHEGLTKKPNGGCCNGNGNCCTNVCEDNLCVPATGPTCSEEGVECSETALCCEDLECVEGFCEVIVCSEEKEGCEVDEDCCDELVCRDSVCEVPEDIEELPNTGASAGASDSSGILGISLAGSAAALIAAKALRRKPASDTSIDA